MDTSRPVSASEATATRCYRNIVRSQIRQRLYVLRRLFIYFFSQVISEFRQQFGGLAHHATPARATHWNAAAFQYPSSYGRPLSVSGRPFCQCFFYLFTFFWPPYSPALVNGGSRKFYTWWTLSGIEEVTTWIFSWSSLNYRVGQKVTEFRIFWDPARKLSALTPERGRIL